MKIDRFYNGLDQAFRVSLQRTDKTPNVIENVRRHAEVLLQSASCLGLDCGAESRLSLKNGHQAGDCQKAVVTKFTSELNDICMLLNAIWIIGANVIGFGGVAVSAIRDRWRARNP